MTSRNALRRLVVLLLLVLSAAGCHESKDRSLSASRSSVTASPAAVVADGVTSATITVVVRNRQGGSVGGKTVVVSATGASNVITQPAGPTDATGMVTATIVSTAAELKTITATVDPGPGELVLDETPSVQFLADATNLGAAQSSVTVSPALGVIANDVELATISVTVRDVNSNPVPGQTVQIASDGSNNTIVQPAGPTDANGQATATIATITAEIKTLTATVDPGPSQVVLNDMPTVQFLGDPATLDATSSTVSALPDTGVIANDLDTSTITVTVRDVNGNPVGGQVVQVAATGTDNTLTQPPAPTDVNGQATATLSTTTAETKDITVTLNPGPGQTILLSAMPTVEFIGDPATIDAGVSTATASRTTDVIADGVDASVITITVRDVNGNPVGGQMVQLDATGSNYSITPSLFATDAAGQVLADFTSTAAEVKTLTVTVNPGPGQVVLNDAPTVEFFGDPSTLDALTSSVVASPTMGVIADGVDTSTITVTVNDVNGNPVEGQLVQIDSSGANNTITPVASLSDAAGQATATLATTTSETKTITVTVNPGPGQVVLADMPTIVFGADPSMINAALSSAVASPATGVVSDGSELSTVTVTVRDVNGNPLPSQMVQIASTGTNNTLTQPAGPTDVNGLATATIASTTAEIKTIMVTVNPGPGQVLLGAMPTVEFVADPATVDALLSSATASPATGVIADDVDTSTITVTVRDANGNPVPGQTVQIVATGSDNTLTQPAGPTDAAGVATATLSTITAETKTITATVNPGPGQVVLIGTPTVEFLGDPSTINSVQSSATASPAAGVLADGATTSTITVTARDVNGNPVAGQTVQIAATGTNNTLTQPAGPTDAAGQATATLATTTAETKTVAVRVNPGPTEILLSDMPTVDFVGDPATIDAANSSASASPSSGLIADDVDTSTITVTVRDVNGNAVAGQTVQIASDGTNNTLVQPAGPTDVNGVASASIATTTAETKTITVTVNPGPGQVVLNDTPTITFDSDPSTIDAVNSSATASPATGVIADDVDASTVTITVRDANNNPVPGQLVQVAASGVNNTLTQPAALTDASGQASASITSTTAETKTITVTVTINGGPSQVVLSDTPTVTFEGDPSTIDAATSSAAASPASGLIADDVDASTITVTVRDVNGNPVTGQTVQIASDGTNNTLTQPAGPTDASGQATATIATTTAETKTITVTVNPGPGQVVLADMPTVTFEGDPATIDATSSSAMASPATGVVADDVETSTLTVTVRDANNNPVAGQTVQIAATGTNNTLTQPAGPTDANGVATATLSTTTAETKTFMVTVTINGGPGQVVLTDTPTVAFVGDPSTIDALLSSASASPTTGLLADDVEASTVTVTVLDVNSNPVAGQTVQIASTGSNNTLTQPAGPTDAAGQASATISSTRAETKTISVTVNPGPTQTILLSDMPTVEFVGDPSTIDAATSSAAASPATGVVADDVETSTLTVTVRDVNGNPVPDQTVQIASDGTNNTLTQPAGPTDAGGQATATISSLTAETKTITVTVNPGPSQVVLAGMPTVVFEGDPATIDAANSSASASPATGVIADGVETSTITVTVRDVNNNPVPGQTVELASDGTNNSLTQPAGPTDASGQATPTIATITAETKTLTITVSINGGPSQVVLGDMPTVAFEADPSTIDAANSSASASPATGVVADDVETSTITVTVRDANNNPVSGQTVQIASTGSNNTLTQPAGPTDAAGQATATIATLTAETKTITVTINGGPGQVVLSDMPTVEFVGDPSLIDAANSSAAISPATGVLADGVETTTVTVTVRDSNNNPVGGQTVQLATTGAENTLTQPAAVTDASGQATGTLATTAAELKTFTVTVNPGPSQVVLADAPQADFVWPLANTYFVRVSGSDGNSGTSPADAWGTIGMAASSVVAGDTVYVGAGTYNESVSITTGGTAGNPIRFVADTCGFTGDSGAVIVDGGGANQTFHVDGADYVAIDGFTITGTVTGGGAGGAILVGSTVGTDVTLRNNTIYGNDRGIYVWNVTSVTIENNRISNNTGATADAIRMRDADDGTVRNNLIYNNGRHGLFVDGNSSNLLLEGNTLYANGDDQVFASGGMTSAILRNNIVSAGLLDGLDFNGGASGTSTYNLVWGNSGVDWNGVAMGVGDQSADPLFIDPDGADGFLGGAQGADDQFQLDAVFPSSALDAGSTTADALGLSDGTTLADRTSRTDEVLDGTAPDAATVNLGYHYAVSPSSLSALDPDDARLFFGLADGGQVSARTWDDSAGSWSARTAGPPVGADILWTQNRISPLANDEELLAVLSDTGSAGVLDLFQWNGVCWTEEWSSAAIDVAHTDKRGFDLELEAGSADALVVYSNNTATPVYRTRTNGVWGAETSLPLNDGGGPNPDPNSGIVLWIELAQRAGTDELALVYADANADLVALIWDGTQWLTASATLLENDVKTNPISGFVHNRAFDAAYENGGDLMVAWARTSTTGFWYSTKAAGSTTFTAATAVPTAPSSGVPHYVDLAAEPGGDRIAGGFFDMGDGTERLGLAVWNGAAWVNAAQYDAQILNVNDTATGDFQGAVGWVGTSGVAVCVYADNQSGTLDWVRWNGTTWSVQPDLPIVGMGNTESVFIESFGGQDALMMMLSDSNSDLYSATYDGTTWTVLSSGAALETTLSSIDTAPFGFAIE